MLRFLKCVSIAGEAELLMREMLDSDRRGTVHNYDWVKATQRLEKARSIYLSHDLTLLNRTCLQTNNFLAAERKPA